MVTTTRPLLWVTISGLSILCLYIYFYSNIFYNNRPLLKFRMILLNKTNLFIHQRNEHWHDKIKEKIQARAHFGFIHAFIASISIIVVSELGDKTFFIGAIMAMRHSRLTVYSGAMSALGAMTILSALLGNIVTNFIPRIYTYYLSSLLFAGFGIKMLKDGYAMSSNEGAEEYKEVQEEVEKAESINDLESVNVAETVNKSSKANQQQQQQLVLTKQSITAKITLIIRRYVSVIFIQAFMMTFLAEWGDRSQIATITLAASENLVGVIVGGTIGHGLCTGLAVIGGRFVAQKISPKMVTIAGGVVFLCFAFSVLCIRPKD